MTGAPVAFLTSNLGMGGAERHVELVVHALHSAGRGVDVVSVEEAGPRADALAADGVRVTDLAAGDRWWLRAPAVIAQVVRQLRLSDAGVVMTNGYSAEIVGRIAAGSPAFRSSSGSTTSATSAGSACATSGPSGCCGRCAPASWPSRARRSTTSPAS